MNGRPSGVKLRARKPVPESVPDRVARIVRTWTGPAALTLLDQGTSAGANFILQIVLARRLAPESYGAFNVAYAVYLVLLSVPNSILFEPMSVLGQRRPARTLDAYTVGLFRANVALSIVLALVLAASIPAYGVGGADVARATAWFALGTPCLMAFQFLRRACYLRLAPGSALRGSMVYAVVVLACLGVLRGGLSVVSATMIMGGAALAGSVAMLVDRGTLLEVVRQPVRWIRLRSDVVACWSYGKWLLASSLVGWFAGSAYLPLAAVTSGLGAAGALRAVDNLFQPVGQGMTALASLASPWLSRRMVERGAVFVRSRMWIVGLTVAAGAAAYALLAWALGDRLLSLAYGPATPYLTAVSLIPLLGGVYVIRGLVDVGLGTGLRAQGNFRTAFFAAGLGSAVMVTAGVPLTRTWGPAGMVGAMLLAGLAQLVVMLPAALSDGGRRRPR